MKTVHGRRFAVIGALLLSCVATGLASAQEEGEFGLAIGSTPPAVTIEDLDGHAVDLGQIIRKRPVLLEFWATWCPLCQALEPKLAAAHQRYGSQVDFISIAVAVNETPSSVKRHLARHPIPVRFLWDGNGDAVRAFQAPSTSYIVVLDASGKVSYTGSGDEQDIDAAVRTALK